MRALSAPRPLLEPGRSSFPPCRRTTMDAPDRFSRLPRAFGSTVARGARLRFAGPASADPLLDQKKAQYDKVQHQVPARQSRRAAHRAIRASGRAAAQLKTQINDANRRLAAARPISSTRRACCRVDGRPLQGRGRGHARHRARRRSLDEVTGRWTSRSASTPPSPRPSRRSASPATRSPGAAVLMLHVPGAPAEARDRASDATNQVLLTTADS